MRPGSQMNDERRDLLRDRVDQTYCCLEGHMSFIHYSGAQKL
jgi:hypothetical protein